MNWTHENSYRLMAGVTRKSFKAEPQFKLQSDNMTHNVSAFCSWQAKYYHRLQQYNRGVPPSRLNLWHKAVQLLVRLEPTFFPSPPDEVHNNSHGPRQLQQMQAHRIHLLFANEEENFRVWIDIKYMAVSTVHHIILTSLNTCLSAESDRGMGYEMNENYI